MRITFDTNAWEQIFGADGPDLAGLRGAFMNRGIEGFICETGFRIEAIRKRDRPAYFQQPHMDTQLGLALHDGRLVIKISIGPDDSRHPGLPPEQIPKLERALAAGVKLLRGGAWMGLPTPPQIRDPTNYVREDPEAAFERQQREVDVSYLIEQRGVGKAAFEAAEGWKVRALDGAAERRLSKACAEWTDGETVAAHVAYQNDILCTNDRARGAGRSVFDSANRAWLAATYQVKFLSVGDLAAAVSK